MSTAPVSGAGGEPWSLAAYVTRLEGELREVSIRVRALETRMNVAIGGVGVIGVTAIVNLVTNILQTPGVVK